MRVMPARFATSSSEKDAKSPRCRTSRAAARIRSRPSSTVRWRSWDEYGRGVIGGGGGTLVQLTTCLIPLYMEYNDATVRQGEPMQGWYGILKVVHVLSVV